MTIRVTITKPGVTDAYGIAMVVGTTYTVEENFGLSLISQGRASDTDASLVNPGVGGAQPGDVVYCNAATLAAPTAQMLASYNVTFALDVAPFTRYVSNGDQLVAFQAFVGVPPPTGGDDAPMLRAYFAMADTTLMLQPGTYLLASRRGASEALKDCLVPANGLRVIGWGGRSGATVIKADDTLPTNSALIRATDPTNLRFEGFKLDGNKARLTVGQRGADENEGFNWKGVCTNIVMDDLWITSCGQDGIDVDPAGGAGGAGARNTSSGYVIRNSLIESNGGLGIHNCCKGMIVEATVVIRNNCTERVAAAVAPYGGVDVSENDVTISAQISGNAFGQVVVDPTTPGTVYRTNFVDAKITAAAGTYALLARASTLALKMRGGTFTGATDTVGVLSETGCHDWDIGGTEFVSASTTVNLFGHIGDRLLLGPGCTFVGGVRQIQVNGAYWRLLGITVDSAGAEFGLYGQSGSNGRVVGCRFLGTPTQGTPRSMSLGNGAHYVCDNDIAYGISGFTGNIVRRNRGVVTEGQTIGTTGATIANGASSANVTHGLTNSGIAGIAPVVVTLNKRTSEDIWVTAKSTGVFTVNRAGTSGDLIFDASWTA